MQKQDFYTNQFKLFLFFVAISLVNIILSAHFITIMLAGVVFIVFDKLFQDRHHYSLIWIILIFLVIENVQGFRIFSLFLIAIFLQAFIKPLILNTFSSFLLTRALYIVLFYIVAVVVYTFFVPFNIFGIFTVVINIILDIIIVRIYL
jgi:hypothetical protein